MTELDAAKRTGLTADQRRDARIEKEKSEASAAAETAKTAQ